MGFALLWLCIVPFNVFRFALLSFSVVSITAFETEDLVYRAGNSISQSAVAKDLRYVTVALYGTAVTITKLKTTF